MGCTRDLTSKGYVVTPSGSVLCIATLTSGYPDRIYFEEGILLPKDVFYCGVYSISTNNPLDPTNYETRKNIAVTRTDGKNRFAYFFEKTDYDSKIYYFHGRYKYKTNKIKTDIDEETSYEITFHLEFVDRPIIM